MKTHLMIVFAKAPVAGRVKTRLIPRLSPEGAAELHRALVEDVWRRLAGWGGLELHTDQETEAWPDLAPRRVQSTGDLGQRMLHALGAGLGEGYEPVMILGGDAPGLPESHVRELLESPADVTFGPALDGGYYAICCRRIHPRMFDGVRWSTKDALAGSTAAARACGLSVRIGPGWFDIDEPEDLERLRDYPSLAGFAA